MNNAAIANYRSEFARVEPQLPGAGLAWLRDLRQRAMQRFDAQGLPTTRNEAWKYTDVGPLARRSFPLRSEISQLSLAAIESYLLPRARDNGYRLVFVDGRYSRELSSGPGHTHGVQIKSLAEAVEHSPELVKDRLGRVADTTQGFAALNAALFSDGVFLHLESGTTVTEPIELVYVASGVTAAAAQLRNLIVAETRSRATIIETYIGLGDESHLTNAINEISLGDDAQIEHYQLEQESSASYHIRETSVRQQRASAYTAHAFHSGARLARNEIRVTLDGEDAACTLNGLYLGRARQHIDIYTWIDHRQPRGISREFFKGILSGHARGIFSGRTVVHPDAQKTDAQQLHHSLLLSDEAEADSRPQLEIYADDVKCGHGATVGQLDDDALFYLRSRGIDDVGARNLLIHAFAADVIQRMTLAPIRKQLEKQVDAQFLHPSS